MANYMAAIAPVVITLCAALIASVAQYTLKRHIVHFRLGVSGIFAVLRKKGLLLGLGLYALSLVVYLFALRSAPLSVVYPIFATTFIFVALFARFLLGEKLGWMRILGIALVFIGIVFVAATY